MPAKKSGAQPPRSALDTYIPDIEIATAEADAAASADVIYDVNKAPRPSKAQKPMTVRTYADVQDQFDTTVDGLKRAKGQVIGALMNLVNRGEISGDTIKAEIRAMQYEREE